MKKSELRRKVLQVRVNAAELREIKKAAKAAKQPPSTWAREALIGHLTPAVTPAASHT